MSHLTTYAFNKAKWRSDKKVDIESEVKVEVDVQIEVVLHLNKAELEANQFL